jgi:hypothetical protein
MLVKDSLSLLWMGAWTEGCTVCLYLRRSPRACRMAREGKGVKKPENKVLELKYFQVPQGWPIMK